MYGRVFQYVLIALMIVVGAFFSIFFYRELFPEYRIYQNAYVALEQMRASATQTEPSAFAFGIKQIVLPQPNNGPEIIDRCISCHVALDVEAYSPTKLKKDLNGVIMRDQHGVPIKVPNDQYVFNLLDKAIEDAQSDPYKLTQLEALNSFDLGERTINMRKVLAMHPLMGREERPFQFHSPEEIGCTSCHNGNGRALTTDKAHGPVFDGTYEPSFEGHEQFFLEKDPKNDPPFSKVFNNKPGHTLLFQTTPLFVGGLLEANCIQCHLSTKELMEHQKTGEVQQSLHLDQKLLEGALESDEKALQDLMFLQNQIGASGVAATLSQLTQMAADPKLPKTTRSQLRQQKKWIEKLTQAVPPELQKRAVEAEIHIALLELLGTPEAIDAIKKLDLGTPYNQAIDQEKIKEALNTGKGQIYQHTEALKKIQNSTTQLQEGSKELTASSEFDRLTPVYRLGEEEFFWQACYACHRIDGLSRGGVGPNLTQEGFGYPWFIKLKIRWPQGTFTTSRMPNMHLDHRELEALTTFLLAQKGKRPVVSDIDYKTEVKAWDEGKKRPFEEPLPPSEIHNLHRGMTIFATEGCAACHRLRGFNSSVGFSLEAQPNSSWEELQTEREWFSTHIPELVGSSDISGSLLAQRLQQHADSIDQHIVANAKQTGLLDELNQKHPELLLSFYSPFAYAMRAKNHELHGQALKAWQDRVQRVLMMYIQEYGLGRLIGPRLNWSGIYRSDAWLMQHFYDPAGLVPRSLMPSFRFDDTKFAALTYMLGELGRKNLAENRLRWKNEGFKPQAAYELYCSQCHGPSERRDEAPLLQWIYPIPKSLRNNTFLNNLTRPRMIESILHGVKGTPMPPWGETPSDKAFINNQPVLNESEVEQLVEWLMRSLPGSSKHQSIPKWEYSPEDVLKDLKREKDPLRVHSTSVWNDANGPLLALSLGDIAYLGSAEEEKPLTVESLFDMRNNPVAGGTDAQGYYIQERFATPENIAAGQRFFLEYCAVCHGAEGGGDGPRAAEMYESKPRILTNIHWIDTRDDLRLLRSIKYGVPGTSMIAWGDATSMLQRLQLVLYIRHLSAQLQARDELAQALYIAFESPSQQIELLRAKRFAEIAALQSKQAQLHLARQALEAQSPGLNQEKATQTYQDEQLVKAELEKLRQEDTPYTQLIHLLAEEQRLDEAMGNFLLNSRADPRVWHQFIGHVRAQEGQLRVVDGKLILSKKNTLQEDQEVIRALFTTLFAEKQLEAKQIGGQFATPARREALAKLTTATELLGQIQDEFLSTLFEMQRLHQAQEKTLQQFPKEAFEIVEPKEHQEENMDKTQGSPS